MVILQDIATDSPVWLKLLDSGLTIFILSIGIVVLWKMWKQTQDKITNYNETDRKRAEDIIAKNTDAINKNTDLSLCLNDTAAADTAASDTTYWKIILQDIDLQKVYLS